MEKSHFVVHLFAYLVFFIPLFLQVSAAKAAGTEDGSEAWGYAEVRPRAHMFWWYYRSPNREQDPNKPWPIILWLQGGPCNIRSEMLSLSTNVLMCRPTYDLVPCYSKVAVI